MLHNIWQCYSSLAIFALLLPQGLARIPADQFEVPVPEQALNPVQVGDDAGTVISYHKIHMFQRLIFVYRASVLF